MHKLLVSTVASVIIAITFAAAPAPAFAADAGAVLRACDRTPGCSYAQSKDGSIQGCSSQSGVCFNCDVDGKRECTQTLIVQTGLTYGRKGNAGVAVFR
ncbi:MAG: hypothetical protein ACYCZU_05040 [Devosia sp.]